MVGVALTLIVLAVAVEAHLRGRQPTGVRRSLALFVAGVVVQRLLFLALQTPSGMGPLLAIGQELAGLAAWTGLARLLSVGARRRDLIVRGILAVICVLFVSIGESVQSAVLFTVLALFSFKWIEPFPTRQRFWLALGMFALFVFTLRVSTPSAPSVQGPILAAIEFGRWSGNVSRIMTLIYALALFRAFVKDPSLGIRTVGRRLALSHVLVVLVPLLLIGLLWVSTTVLGVNSDRAMVAARALESEGRALQGVLREALRSEAGSQALQARFAARGREWDSPRLYLREGGAWRRASGDSVDGESRLLPWADSLGKFPAAGIVDLQTRTFYGAAMRDSADSSRAAIVIVGAESLLAGEPARVASATLLVATRTLGGDRAVDNVRAAAEKARQDQEFRITSPRPSRPAAPQEALTAADSLRLAQVKRTLTRMGMPDSMVRAERRGGRLSIRTSGDTLSFENLSPGGNLPLLDGHALVPALGWDGTRLRATRAMLTASVEPGTALAGLWGNLRENPVGYLPLILIATLTLLVLLVAIFDFVMVAGMGRSITAAIEALKGGAARLEAGDLAHRIEVKGKDDLWSVAGAFNQALAGFERTRELEKERTRLENELALAQQIQARLLPPGPPSISGFEIAGHYDPARQVGGDYFDHLDLGSGRVLLVIADVSGKGVPAALLMSGFRASLMSQDLSARDPVALCGKLNDFMVQSVETGKFITTFVAFADANEGTLHYVNAGHNPPLLMRADGTHASLEEGGLMFGVLPGAPYTAAKTAFGMGDLLVLYTDGVVEGASPSQELWGDDRLLEAVRRERERRCTELVQQIAGEVRAFEEDAGPADDVTLLVARRI